MSFVLDHRLRSLGLAKIMNALSCKQRGEYQRKEKMKLTIFHIHLSITMISILSFLHTMVIATIIFIFLEIKLG